MSRSAKACRFLSLSMSCNFPEARQWHMDRRKSSRDFSRSSGWTRLIKSMLHVTARYHMIARRGGNFKRLEIPRQTFQECERSRVKTRHRSIFELIGGNMDNLTDYLSRISPALAVVALVFVLVRPGKHLRVVLYILTFILLRDAGLPRTASPVCCSREPLGRAAVQGIRRHAAPPVHPMGRRPLRHHRRPVRRAPLHAGSRRCHLCAAVRPALAGPDGAAQAAQDGG